MMFTYATVSFMLGICSVCLYDWIESHRQVKRHGSHCRCGVCVQYWDEFGLPIVKEFPDMPECKPPRKDIPSSLDGSPLVSLSDFPSPNKDINYPDGS